MLSCKQNTVPAEELPAAPAALVQLTQLNLPGKGLQGLALS